MQRETEKLLQSLLNSLLPNRMGPRLAEVTDIYEGAGAGKYSCDVELLEAGSLEKTGVVLPEVPISPIWAGSGGRGLYALPEKGQVVIVGFIQWDLAFPYVAGVWGDQYDAAEHPAKTMTITDGKAKIMIDTDSLFKFENDKKSLKGLVDDLVDAISSMTTMGPPPKHVVSPDSIAQLKQCKAGFAQLLK